MIENWEMFENMKKGDKFFMFKGTCEYINHVGICEFIKCSDWGIRFNWGVEDEIGGRSCMVDIWKDVKIAPICPALEIMFNTKGE